MMQGKIKKQMKNIAERSESLGTAFKVTNKGGNAFNICRLLKDQHFEVSRALMAAAAKFRKKEFEERIRWAKKI